MRQAASATRFAPSADFGWHPERDMSGVVELRPLRVLVVEDSEFDYELLLVALSRARDGAARGR